MQDGKFREQYKQQTSQIKREEPWIVVRVMCRQQEHGNRKTRQVLFGWCVLVLSLIHI